LRWHLSAGLKDRFSPPNDVHRDCRDMSKAIQTQLAVPLPHSKEKQLQP